MKTKIIIVSILFVCSSIISDENTCNLSNNLKNTLLMLKRKNGSTIIYLQKRRIELLLEKEKLIHFVSINCSPELNIKPQIGIRNSIGKGNVSTVLKGGVDINGWNLSFDFDPMTYGYNNCGAIFMPIISNKRKKILQIENLIKVDSEKACFQLENLFLQDLKEVWISVAEIEKLKEEIKIRNNVNDQIDSLCTYLSKYSQNGFVSKRIANVFRLTSQENGLQILLLEKRFDYLKNKLKNKFFIDEINTNVIIQENAQFLGYIEKESNSPFFNSDVISNTDIIDSLNLCEIIIRKELETDSDLSLMVGPVFSKSLKIKDGSVGAGAKLSLSFLSKKSRIANPGPISPFSFSVRDSVIMFDSTIMRQGKNYELEIEREIKNIIDELGYGMQYSLPSINELYTKLINVKSNLINLKYSYFDYKIDIIHSLKHTSLRNQISSYLLDK